MSEGRRRLPRIDDVCQPRTPSATLLSRKKFFVESNDVGFENLNIAPLKPCSPAFTIREKTGAEEGKYKVDVPYNLIESKHLDKVGSRAPAYTMRPKLEKELELKPDLSKATGVPPAPSDHLCRSSIPQIILNSRPKSVNLSCSPGPKYTPEKYIPKNPIMYTFRGGKARVPKNPAARRSINSPGPKYQPNRRYLSTMKKTPAFYMGARFKQPKRSTCTPGPAAYGPPICARRRKRK